MNITPELWPRLSPLMDEALDLPVEQRAGWLEQLEKTHGDLAPLLRHLLAGAARVESSDFLESLPILDGLTQAPDVLDADPGLRAGVLIGPYELQEPLGRGGMGTVWRARRADGTLKRPVALKLPNAGLVSSDWMERFSRERDILAVLEHPGIARLYDAGTSDEGKPYLALELVEGVPIDRYCDQQRLSVRARVELFLQMLEAVQYAHTNLVVHRDLKPSNILVTAQGAVRLLDFGIAKLLPAALSARRAATELAGRAMTPEYSAPEQITGGAITTATDVYSAGVVLSELLTGTRPYRLARQSLGALEEAIVETDPVWPSHTDVSPETSQLRGATPKRLRRLLAGDLDTIVLKALKKNPEERYSTIDAMLQDLQRHLHHEPLQARPDQAWYRVSKFISRNKVPVVLASALVVAVMGGLAVALWGLHAARAQATRAEAAKGLLVKIFSTGNPSNTSGKDLTAHEILVSGSKQIDFELRDQPALLGELHSEIASVFGALGANEDSLANAQQAVQLLESSGEQAGDAYFNALYRVANAYAEEERWDDARAAFGKLRTAAAARLGRQNPWEARALEDYMLIDSSNGRMPEALADASAALAMNRALFGEHSPQYLRVLGSSEQLYLDQGRPEEALTFIRRVIALSPGVPSYALDDRLMDRYMLASTLFRLQRYAESAQELQGLLPEMENNMGPGNDRTAKARNTLALDLQQIGELPAALALQQHNLELIEQAHGGDKDMQVAQPATLARILTALDRTDEALHIQRRVVAYFDAKYSTPTLLRERLRLVLGDMLVRSGAVPEGLASLKAALANMDHVAGYHPDPVYAEALQLTGNAYRQLGRAAEAKASLEAACAMYTSMLGAQSVAALRCRTYRLMAALQVARDADLPALRTDFLTLKASLLSVLPPHQALRAELLLIEAALDRRMGDLAKAAAVEQEGIRAYRTRINRAPTLPLRALH